MKKTLDLLSRISDKDLEFTDQVPEIILLFFNALAEDSQNLGHEGFDAEAAFVLLLGSLNQIKPTDGFSAELIQKLERLYDCTCTLGSLGLLTFNLYQGVNASNQSAEAEMEIAGRESEITVTDEGVNVSNQSADSEMAIDGRESEITDTDERSIQISQSKKNRSA